MCGIIGYISKNKATHELLQLITNGFMAIEERGKQACGFAYTSGKYYKFWKSASQATEVVTKKPFSRLLQAAPTRVILHTRQATSGTTRDNNNNHPFALNGLVWIHNGIIYNHKELAKQHKLNYKGECDSYIIGLLIDYYLRKGHKIIKAIRKTCRQLKGYYAVALMYKYNLYLINGGGELYYTRFGNSLVFASGKRYLFGTDKALTVDYNLASGEIVEIKPNLGLTSYRFTYKPCSSPLDVYYTSGAGWGFPAYTYNYTIGESGTVENKPANQPEWDYCEVCNQTLFGSEYKRAKKTLAETGFYACDRCKDKVIKETASAFWE